MRNILHRTFNQADSGVLDKPLVYDLWEDLGCVVSAMRVYAGLGEEAGPRSLAWLPALC